MCRGDRSAGRCVGRCRDSGRVGRAARILLAGRRIVRLAVVFGLIGCCRRDSERVRGAASLVAKDSRGCLAEVGHGRRGRCLLLRFVAIGRRRIIVGLAGFDRRTAGRNGRGRDIGTAKGSGRIGIAGAGLLDGLCRGRRSRCRRVHRWRRLLRGQKLRQDRIGRRFSGVGCIGRHGRGLRACAVCGARRAVAENVDARARLRRYRVLCILRRAEVCGGRTVIVLRRLGIAGRDFLERQFRRVRRLTCGRLCRGCIRRTCVAVRGRAAVRCRAGTAENRGEAVIAGRRGNLRCAVRGTRRIGDDIRSD